jgi:hypothetical protein
MSPQRQGGQLPIAWMEVLNKIQHTISLALNDLARHEGANCNQMMPTDVKDPASVPGLQDRSAGGITRSSEFSSVQEHLEQSAREADTELQRGEESLRQWLEAIGEIAPRLAKWARTEV